MEFDLRIYSYNCDNGKIGTLITIYNNIEEANNDTEVSRSKIKESITENKIVTTSKINKTTKEIVPGLTIDLSVTRVKMNYFFTGGIYFDEVNNGFYRRVKKYENGEKIYDMDNLWQMIDETDNVYVSNTGYIKTSKGKINKGAWMKDGYYARLKIDGERSNVKMQDLVAKYFDKESVKDKMKEKAKNKSIIVVRITKDHYLAGVYDSYSEAQKETGINRQIIAQKCGSDHAHGDYLWFSEEYHLNIIKKCLRED